MNPSAESLVLDGIQIGNSSEKMLLIHSEMVSVVNLQDLSLVA